MTTRRRLAIVATHPIQYHAHWYRALAAHPQLGLHVYYCHQATPPEQSQAGFGIEFDWDVPLLGGYSCSFLKNVARRPELGRFTGLDTPEIKTIIGSRQYDAVMVNGWNYKSAWQAMRACWASGVKLMVRSDSHLHTRRSVATRMAKTLAYHRFIPRFDACLAAGEWSREYFLHYGARPERVFIVPHAIDDSFFAREAERLRPQRREIRKRWGLGEQAIVFAFVGKCIAKKRPLDFVRAVAQAAAHNPTIQGIVVGDGPMRSECESFAQARRAPVHFAGFLNQSRITEAYVACDALVLPSNGDETWGLVVNEAMACGRLCMVSDHVGCGPDLIVPGETGMIFPLGNIAALAESMKDSVREPERLTSMGENARQTIKGHSVEVAVNALVQCLEIISGGR